MSAIIAVCLPSMIMIYLILQPQNVIVINKIVRHIFLHFQPTLGTLILQIVRYVSDVLS